jgi:hypothetical protein
MPGSVFVINRHIKTADGRLQPQVFENATVTYDAVMLRIEHDSDPSEGPIYRRCTLIPIAAVAQCDKSVQVPHAEQRMSAHAH